jgi:ribokinase
MPRVVVVGSLNCDHTVKVTHLPRRGETVLAHGYTRDLGGKGFNQAVTTARMGVDVVMVGCVGADVDGDALLQALAGDGIDVGYVRIHGELATGRAEIAIDEAGENTIVVVPGANAATTFPSAVLDDASVVLAQLECPLDVVGAAMAAGHAVGATTILNAAPARPLTEDLLDSVDYLVANEHEADNVGELSYRGVAIVTGGEKGALVLVPGSEPRRVPAIRVPVVDTTAAGDAFCGCFAAAIAEKRSLDDAVARAVAGGALAVTTAGAFASLPYADEVDDLLAQVASDSQS